MAPRRTKSARYLYPGPLLVRNTFIDDPLGHDSLEGFLQERQAKLKTLFITVPMFPRLQRCSCVNKAIRAPREHNKSLRFRRFFCAAGIPLRIAE